MNVKFVKDFPQGTIKELTIKSGQVFKVVGQKVEVDSEGTILLSNTRYVIDMPEYHAIRVVPEQYVVEVR